MCFMRARAAKKESAERQITKERRPARQTDIALTKVYSERETFFLCLSLRLIAADGSIDCGNFVDFDTAPDRGNNFAFCIFCPVDVIYI